MSQALYHPDLSSYLDELVPDRAYELVKMESYAAETGFPIIGPASGAYCHLLARLIGAHSVYEMGSGFGYSTAWFAKAVRENGGGVVHHVVWDAALSQKAMGHLGALGFHEHGSSDAGTTSIKYTVGEAIAALKLESGPFDVIFMDIDKPAYVEALATIEDKLRPGGLLIVDNVLWSGRVLDASNKETTTETIRQLNKMVFSSDKWCATIAPIRDGLLTAIRI